MHALPTLGNRVDCAAQGVRLQVHLAISEPWERLYAGIVRRRMSSADRCRGEPPRFGNLKAGWDTFVEKGCLINGKFLESGLKLASPVFKLPRLRSLKLYSQAAMLFDFDSLDFMPSLVELILIVATDQQPIPATSVPRLSAYICRRRVSTDTSISEPDPAMVKWKDRWSLPFLETVHFWMHLL